MKKIVFFFPWKEVSGGPYYLCRMADALAGTGRYEVYYIDYYNSLSDDILEDFRVRKIPYFGKPREMEIFCEEPIVMITPIYWVHMIPVLHPDSKLVLINWHNECIPVLKKNWKPLEEDFQFFLKLAAETDSVSCMDFSTYSRENEFGVQFRERYLSIVVPERKVLARPELVAEDEINIAIFGRLTLDKVYAAVDVLDHLVKLKRMEPVNIHIIGSGRSVEEENILFQRYYPKNFNLIKYGTMELQKALKAIGENADILFAMGTSALDGASIGIPTVIIPNEVTPFSCGKYVFLYQSKGYMLGWGTEQLGELDLPIQTMEEIIESVYRYGRKEELGKACRQYCLENHGSNLNQLLDAVDSSTLTYRQIDPIIHNKPNLKGNGNSWITVLKRITKKFFSRLVTALGRIVKTYGILSIPIIIITKRDATNYNLFFCLIPIFQIKKINGTYSARLLFLVWLEKAGRRLWHLLCPGAMQRREIVLPVQTAHNRLRQRIEEKISSHQKIRVCFFEPRIACWQFGKIYDLMEQSGVFEPMVVVVPFFTMGDDAMIEYMDTSFAAFQEKGYRTIRGYDKKTGEFLDIKKELDPDVVLYSMYWKNHFQENSYITNFLDIYTFLYSYGFDTVRYQDRAGYNYELQNKVTRYYLPTKIHKGIAEDNMDNHAENVYVTGCLKFDYLLDPNYIPENVWKPNGSKKRVIWAPHHTLNERQPYAQCCAFLDLYEFMLEIAEQYRDTIQFTFKPHPMLKPRLYKLWGKRRTDEYYQRWANGFNTQLADGEYFDLFLTSDAMILDSVSFIPEYAATGKPAFFTYGKDTRFPVNRFGKAITQHLYRNDDPETLFTDIRNYLDHVVLLGRDEKKAARDHFVKTYMLMKDGQLAAEHVYEDMCRIILEDKRLAYQIRWDDLPIQEVNDSAMKEQEQ